MRQHRLLEEWCCKLQKCCLLSISIYEPMQLDGPTEGPDGLGQHQDPLPDSRHVGALQGACKGLAPAGAHTAFLSFTCSPETPRQTEWPKEARPDLIEHHHAITRGLGYRKALAAQGKTKQPG